MDDTARLRSQLEPLAAALAEGAQRDADARIDEAEASAQSIQGKATSQASEILSSARTEGEAAAARESAHRLVAAKREARRRVLGAQRAAYDALFDAALAAVGESRERPAYTSLEERLAQTAKTTLGADANVQRNPGGQGGVVARLNGRSVDLRLPVLVRRCIAEIGKDISKLWA